MSHHPWPMTDARRVAIILLFAIISIPLSLVSASRITGSRSASRARNGANRDPRPTTVSNAALATQAEWIRQVPMTSNDIVYSQTTHKLYLSVPSAAGLSGNTITAVDPVSGTAETPVFVGSEPKKLALSDDGQTLYVSLDGAAAVQRFDVISHVLGVQFSIGGPATYFLSDLVVAPGNPNLVAVSKNYRGLSPADAGVTVFDNGVQRPTTTQPHLGSTDQLTFSASASTLYGGGNGGGLSTIAIDASGATISSTASFPSGGGVRFDNGLVYGRIGPVINPTNGTIVGTFSGVGSGPFTTESSVNRAYFLTGSQSGLNYSLSLKVFDQTTFALVGALTISGVNGNASSLVRWGSNGLAFRTDGGQLFLIQTDLIPGGEPVPSPTPTPIPSPTPSPSPVSTFVRQVSLSNNALVFSSATQKLYASLPSTAEISGNSIAPITPDTGVVGTPVFVGSEPTKLALADDGHTLYAALEGAAAVRRFDIVSGTAGLQFPVATGFPLFVNDLAVMPGNPNAVAVGRANRISSPDSDGVAVYENGVRRNNVAAINTFSIEYSNVPSRIYSKGFGGAIDSLGVDASGVTWLGFVPVIRGGELRFDNGLIYMSQGDVIDPEAGTVKGSFTGTGLGSDSIMTTDSSLGRAFFLNSGGNSLPTLTAYDLNTFVPLGSITLDLVLTGGATSLVRWGTNGLAFRTPKTVFLIQSSLVSPSGSVPSPTPTPSPSPSPSPTPYVPTFTRPVSLPANDLVFNQANQKIYASVPSFAGANGNSITPIDPVTSVIGPSVFVGSEPNRLALSGDGSTLHISLDGAAAIRRFDIPTQTPGPQFTWGSANTRPLEMLVVPGSPLSLVTSGGGSVAVYDDGIRRPDTSSGDTAVGPIAFGATPSVLYGYNGGSSDFRLVKLNLGPNGISGSVIGSNLLSGFTGARLKFADGRLYQTARVVDPEARALVGSFGNTGSNPVMALDPALGRIFFLSAGVNANVTLRAYDINTFLSLGEVTIEGVTGNPANLVRWGTNGLAFNTVRSIFDTDPGVSHVYLVQSALVSNTGSIGTGVQLSSDRFFAQENNGATGVTVRRSGDVSGTTTVNYATSDGTATDGADYIAANGTLSFAPGELTKVIPIQILDDNFYEGGSETFNITLTSPGGGAVFTGTSSALITIVDNESKPSLFISGPLSVPEGTATNNVATFNVTLSNATAATVTVDYVTADGTAVAGSDYAATSGTLTFAPGTTSLPLNITLLADAVDEPDETFTVNLSNATNVNPLNQGGSQCTILNDDGPPKLYFTSSNYVISEGDGRAILTVFRLGRADDPVSVDYLTSDNGATQTRDYTIAAGTLRFATGELTKTFSVLITDDFYFEQNEFITVTLSNPTGTGASLGSPSFSRITIIDNDSGFTPANPIDNALTFVRQHYYDFLSRFPDQGGLDYWTGQITQCGTDTACVHAKRVDVSNAFFYELEYQQTGSFVYRLYRAAFGNTQPFPNPNSNAQFPNEEKKLPSYGVFAPDRARVKGGATLAQTQLDLANAFVLRASFLTRYPANLDGPGFVDAILANINTDIGANLSSQRDALIALFNQGGRGAVVYRLADDNAAGNPIDNRAFIDAEYNRAFVLTQYFGYLRRNPDIAGFVFWLNQVNSAALRDVAKQHAMVCSFITSTEYQLRFSSVVTHNNTECQ
jgi:hypothetical protein